MKEFEKWKKHNFKPQENLVDTKDYLEGYELGSEHGWEAALGWALGEVYMSSAIKEELNAKT